MEPSEKGSWPEDGLKLCTKTLHQGCGPRRVLYTQLRVITGVLRPIPSCGWRVVCHRGLFQCAPRQIVPASTVEPLVEDNTVIHLA